ncbi:MAG: zf-HC2 domain-containing protein [Microcoleaceae cyanobacterium]
MSNSDQFPDNIAADSNREASVDRDQSEKYELLSAYLDGEVTPEERHQVEQWMANDPQFKAMYFEWLQVRSQWRSMPIPQSTIAPDELAEQVVKQFHRRTRKTLVWKGAAVASVLMAAISGWMYGGLPWGLRQQLSQSSEIEPLRIALHEPVVPIVDPEAVSISVDQPLIQIPKATHSRNLPQQP